MENEAGECYSCELKPTALKRKAAIALVALIFCFFVAMALTHEHYDQRPRTATFIGFTNSGPDEIAAIIHFPGVHPRAPSATFFYKPVYDLKFKVQYTDSWGRGRSRVLRERVGLSTKLPVGEADVLVPVLPYTVSMTVLDAEGELGSYRDNNLFGWAPPAPKARKWEFQMVGILPGITNRATGFELLTDE
jgi:hypothetical protein